MNAYSFGPILLRSVTPADCGEVARLFSLHLAELGLNPDPVLDADMAQCLRAYAPPEGLLLLAIAPDGKAVGMAARWRDEIRRVFVEPAFRRSGIASRLIEALVGQLPSPVSGRYRAVIARDNRASQRLFLSLGFRAAISLLHPDCPPHCDRYELEIVTTRSGRPPAGLAA
jgi:GNAT superfamily N-acetyltransferase